MQKVNEKLLVDMGANSVCTQTLSHPTRQLGLLKNQQTYLQITKFLLCLRIQKTL